MREKVIVRTATTDLHGELFVGTDGLPELVVLEQGGKSSHYRPAQFPAMWRIEPEHHLCAEHPLYEAWCTIERIQQHIRDAQREAEAEDRDRVQQREQDCMDLGKADLEAKGER